MHRYARTTLVVVAAVVAATSAMVATQRFDAHADCLPFVGVAANGGETYAIRSDHTLWHYGEGAVDGNVVPAVPDAVTGVESLSASGHLLAMRDDQVWAWGDNGDGELGDGEAAVFYRPIPLPITGLPATKKAAAGSYHSLALTKTGTVYAWGWGYLGRLGDGTQSSHFSPIQVPGLSGVLDVAAGYYHSVAIKPDRTVVAWGDNFFGQLGDGTHNNYRTSPTPVIRVTGAAKVAANQDMSIALKTDGTVWQWGAEANNVAPTGPVQVSGLSGIVDIAGQADAEHWTALKSDGTVWTWGYSNSYGQLGDGTTTWRPSTGAKVNGLPHIKAIAEGAAHTVALDDNGQVWAWGRNSNGQLGDGTLTDRHTPVRALNLAQCFVPDAQPTVSPTSVPTASPLPTTPPSVLPSEFGTDAPVADCTYVRDEGQLVFGGYAIASGDTLPDLTTVRCTVTVGTANYEITGSAPGRVAAAASEKAAAPAPITICTYAEASYPDGSVVAITPHCRS